MSLLCLRIIGHKFGENNAGIIGYLQAYVIIELLGTKIGKCNEIILSNIKLMMNMN